MATYSPLRYPGGKNKTFDYIQHLVKINKIKLYIEPFAGGAAVAIKLLLNNDVNKIIINDFDKSIYSLWSSILNNTQELIEMIRNTPINMEEWYKQKDIQLRKDDVSELQLAFSTLFLNRTNRSGIIKAGVIGGKNQDGLYKLDCRFNKVKIIEKIESISRQKHRIQIFNLDAKDFISKVIKGKHKSLTFFDPPYYDKGPELYTNFYDHEDHVELANAIKNEMRNKHWILTYDIVSQIEELYSSNLKKKYYLNYSIAKPSKGQELIFFSKNINPGSIEKYLKLV